MYAKKEECSNGFSSWAVVVIFTHNGRIIGSYSITADVPHIRLENGEIISGKTAQLDELHEKSNLSPGYGN